MSDTEQPKPKVKKTRTPEQLEALARAREKALEIRKQNAELRKAEKEIAKHEKEESIKVRKEKVKNYLKKEPVKEVVEEEEPPEEPEPEPKPKPKAKPKKKKVIVVEESESESEEEEEIVVVKKPRAKKVAPQPKPVAPPVVSREDKIKQFRKRKQKATTIIYINKCSVRRFNHYPLLLMGSSPHQNHLLNCFPFSIHILNILHKVRLLIQAYKVYEVSYQLVPVYQMVNLPAF